MVPTRWSMTGGGAPALSSTLAMPASGCCDSAGPHLHIVMKLEADWNVSAASAGPCVSGLPHPDLVRRRADHSGDQRRVIHVRAIQVVAGPVAEVQSCRALAG